MFSWICKLTCKWDANEPRRSFIPVQSLNQQKKGCVSAKACRLCLRRKLVCVLWAQINRSDRKYCTYKLLKVSIFDQFSHLFTCVGHNELLFHFADLITVTCCDWWKSAHFRSLIGPDHRVWWRGGSSAAYPATQSAARWERLRMRRQKHRRWSRGDLQTVHHQRWDILSS